MVAFTGYKIFCQNKLCRHEYTGMEVTWPPSPTGMRDILKMEVCPECGFKTGSRIDSLGLAVLLTKSEIIKQFKRFEEILK